MSTEEEITEVQATHRFDEKKLTAYLKQNLVGFSEELIVRQFKFGQSNPTFLLSAGDKQYVLRKKPPGKLLPTAHMVEREYRILTALKDTEVPVAETYLLCEDDSIIGTAFFMMELLKGRVFRNPALPDEDPAARQAIYCEMNRVLAALHQVDYDRIGLGDYGKPGNYFARQISRWTRQYEAAKTDDLYSMDRLMQWLPQHVPEDDTTSIVHGDYRLENMIFHPHEPRVIGVVDWELSTLGHPLADLAYNCMIYHVEIPGYPCLANTAGGSSGIPTESEYVAEYCRRTGRSGIPHWNFYMAFSMFRYASIVQGVYKRGLQGIAISKKAMQMHKLARSAADKAWELVG